MISDHKKDFVIRIEEDQVDFYSREIQKKFPKVVLEETNQEDVVYMADLVEAFQDIEKHKLGIKKIPRDRTLSRLRKSKSF